MRFMSRTENSLRNLTVACIGQAFGIAVSFVARIAFLRCLSAEYLGLNGLFTNILTILSLAELGVGQAMNFALYKPLARKDTEQVKSLMAFYQRAYRMIGCVIAALGLATVPFYTLLMAEVPKIPHLTLIYCLFVLNTAISYFYSYKRALIICDEKRYIATLYRYVFFFFLNVAQILVLLATHNYILFLLLQVAATLAENIAISCKADELYPYLSQKNAAPLPERDLQAIRKNIGAMLLHKVGGMVVLSTDNLLLSRFVGLAAVGLYSNYSLITEALHKIFRQVFDSIIASVGNLNAADSPATDQKMELVFNRLFFLDFWLYGVSTCCLWVLLNPFISLWLGEEYLFDRLTLLMIVVNFYLQGIRKPAILFAEATGSFYYDRYKPVAEVVINLAASIWLARQLGTAGVFLGTIISTVAACLWVEPAVLYKYVFHSSPWPYQRRFWAYAALLVIACQTAAWLAQCVQSVTLYAAFLLKALLCLAISNGLFYLCFRKNGNYLYFKELAAEFISKLRTLKNGREK